jgi:biopolymer transport protein ExbD
MPSVNQRGSGENSVRAEINVTPLVDVCLVLLIIFMVVTPMLQKGVDVALPQTDQPAKMPEGTTQLSIAVKLDGSVFVGPNWVPMESLARALADIHSQSPDKKIVIKADRALKYREVRDVMRMVNEAGFSGVGLVTEKKEG